MKAPGSQCEAGIFFDMVIAKKIFVDYRCEKLAKLCKVHEGGQV